MNLIVVSVACWYLSSFCLVSNRFAASPSFENWSGARLRGDLVGRLSVQNPKTAPSEWVLYLGNYSFIKLWLQFFSDLASCNSCGNQVVCLRVYTAPDVPWSRSQLFWRSNGSDTLEQVIAKCKTTRGSFLGMTSANTFISGVSLKLFLNYLMTWCSYRRWTHAQRSSQPLFACGTHGDLLSPFDAIGLPNELRVFFKEYSTTACELEVSSARWYKLISW